MAWRSVVITQPARLKLAQRALVVEQDSGTVRVPLEDISVLIIDQPQVLLTASLLAACASAQIAVITVGSDHHPNGVLLPHQPHSRALKVIRAQLALTLPRKKRLWQAIVQRKLHNQADLLTEQGHSSAALTLNNLARRLRSGDAGNAEAHGAQVYFKALFGSGFSRAQTRWHNAALNYGYSVVRATLARNLVAYGFITAIGLHHSSEQNTFNLADDLIEPFRPLIDAHALGLIAAQGTEPPPELSRTDKAHMVQILHEDIRLHRGEATAAIEHFSVLAACEQVVISLSQRLFDDGLTLDLPARALKKSAEDEAHEL